MHTCLIFYDSLIIIASSYKSLATTFGYIGYKTIIREKERDLVSKVWMISLVSDLKKKTLTQRSSTSENVFN